MSKDIDLSKWPVGYEEVPVSGAALRFKQIMDCDDNKPLAKVDKDFVKAVEKRVGEDACEWDCVDAVLICECVLAVAAERATLDGQRPKSV